MPSRIFSLELSSGAFSAIGAIGGALFEVSMDTVEAVVESAGEERFGDGPDEEDAIRTCKCSIEVECRVFRNRGLCCIDSWTSPNSLRVPR